MESSKSFLIIVTLIDGQNFTLPEGAPDKIESFVFAEARFGNESILKSDPIKLTNSNPEFVTELAWQLDKKSLHQLRVERKSIKLQIFMQTRERKKPTRIVSQNNQENKSGENDVNNDSNLTNKVELVGYTIVDLRSAEETEQPRFQWVPLLNPKFRKSVYNRPEIQLAVTLSRINQDQTSNGVTNQPLPKPKNICINIEDGGDDCSDVQSESNKTYDATDSNQNSQLYKTCLDHTLDHTDANQSEKDEIIENDINIRLIDGCFYIYDSSDPHKSTIKDCVEHYKIIVTIPFNSDFKCLTSKNLNGNYYYTITMFGTSLRTNRCAEMTSVETREVEFNIYTTHSDLITTYFELNSSLIIKLHDNYDKPLGLATIQLDQLCNSGTTCRSIEGIFVLQSLNDYELPTSVNPTIGVSVVWKKVSNELKTEQSKLISNHHIEMAREHFGEGIDDYLFKTLNDTHQLTIDEIEEPVNESIVLPTAINNFDSALKDNHHFCFTIDLKHFSYSSTQRLIPTLRELVVRYSYPFFGYKDTITTDASMPINSTNSIIVSGFCEFNFATTAESLLAALKEIPLDLDILTCDHINLNLPERVIATCNLNIAQIMFLDEENIIRAREKPLSTTVSAPIYSIDGEEIGELQVYLCLKDLGKPSFKTPKTSRENINDDNLNVIDKDLKPSTSNTIDIEKLEEFRLNTKKEFESWKEEFIENFTDEVRKRENERFKRMYQRFEVKEAKREQEFKKKLEELNSLEKRLKNSFAYIDSLERRLSSNFEQLKSKDSSLETRLDILDLKISKAVNDIKLNYDKKIDSMPLKYRHSYEDNTALIQDKQKVPSKISSRPNYNAETISQPRRSSLRNPSTNAISLPVRSSSLVKPNEAQAYKLVKRPPNVVVINEINRPKVNSNKLNLSKEAQEKLLSLRREKAELLKKGCRPNDELIQEINSMIEKLAC